MMRGLIFTVHCALAAAAGMAPAVAEQPPSVFGVDAPELAPLGRYAIGVQTLTLVQPAQPDVLAYDPARQAAPLHDRVLVVDVWYPAAPAAGAPPAVYSGSLPSERESPVIFTVPGIAVRGAPPAGADWPLVVVSHGYSNDPAALTWLTENLASKGYVVAAIHHEDPPITDRGKFAGPLLRRPLDIAFVAKSLQRTWGGEHRVDPQRTALIGYSMGGYGVLAAGGAALDPAGPPTKIVPGGLLMPYVRGGARHDDMTVAGLRAVVALAPAGGGTLAAWGTSGIGEITAPLLLIQGDHDMTVDYRSGARAVFDAAVHADRYLLTYEGGGHAIGLGPPPPAMRSTLWDLSWFEDPVWRKERIMEINAHFITAFLDRYVKGERSRDAYLTVATVASFDGKWPAGTAPTAYDAYSPGTEPITVWKGFQRNQAAGLEWLHASAAPAHQRGGEQAGDRH